MNRRLLPTAIVVIAACGPHSPKSSQEPESGQTFSQALELMCQVDEKAGLDAEEDPIGVEGARVDWIHQHIDNGDAIELFTLMRVKSHSEQAEMLRRNTEKALVAECALADALAEQASVLD